MDRASAIQKFAKFLDDLYGYHGPAVPPSGVSGRVWSALPGVTRASPVKSILERYRVNQMPTGWPSPNECVTAATIQCMNMVQDILASTVGFAPIPHADLSSFAAEFDAGGLGAWLTRPPAKVPVIGGMLLPQMAVRVFKAHAQRLRATYGCDYRVELTLGNSVDDLIENLQNGRPTSVHISQPVSLFRNGAWGDYRALFGGVPHTVTLAGYDAKKDTWLILDPAPAADKDYTRWTTPRLMDLWGRKFLFYPPFLSARSAFGMTTLIPDAV